MKKDKLYTVNKRNKQGFAQNVDRVHNNIFDGFGDSFMWQKYGTGNPYDRSNYSYTGSFGPSGMYYNDAVSVPYSLKNVDTSGISNEIHSIANPEIKTPEIKAVDTPSKPKMDAGSALNKAAQIGGAALSMYGSAKSLATPQGKGKLSGIRNQVSDLNNYRISTTNLDAIDQVASNFKPLKTNYKWKDFYANGGWLARPYTYDAGGRMAMGTLGNTFNGAMTGLQVGEPWGAAAGAVIGLGSGIIGSIVGHNRAKGMAREANRLSTDANNGMYYKIDSAVDNAKRYNALNLGLNTPYAYGGLIDLANNNMDATNYGLISDYLTMKDNQARNKGNMIGYLGNVSSEPLTFKKGGKIHINPKNKGKLTETARRTGKSFEELSHSKNPLTRKRAIFALNSRKWKHSDGGFLNEYADNGDTFFALGGDMQTNGADFTDGLNVVSAGGTHEENPYSGVQMGLAPDGSPNLVEENETIFNDYVFSNRIKPKKEVLRKFHMYSKGGKLTYADVSKRLEKEAKERPNDPLSQASLKKMLEQLAEAQEQQKAEEEAERARKAFEALSPEEQQQVLAQIAAQQQAGAQQGNGENSEEIPVDENGNPVDAAAMQQPAQPVEEAPQEAPQEMQGYAEGGMLDTGHKYPDGGEMIKQAILNALKLKNGQRVLTEGMFNDWAKENNVTDFDYNGDWLKALDNGSFKAALAKASPELAYVIANGYGTSSPSQYVGNTDTDWSKVLGDYGKELGFGEPDFRERGFIPYTRNSEYAEENLKSLRDSKNYTDFTKYILDNWDSDYVQNYLKHLDRTAQGNHLFDSEGNPVEGAKEYFEKARTTGPLGYYSFTPTLKGDVNKNLLVGKDGTVSVIDNSDLSGLTKIDSPYKWTDAKGNNTYTFYSMPEAAGNTGDATKETEKIPYLPEMSEAETLLPNFLGAGLWASGLGRPDTSGLDAAVEYSRGLSPLAGYRGIGNYRRYVPKDVNAPLNGLYSYSKGTDRSLRNNNGSVGALMTGLSNNAYNTMIAAAKTQGSVDQLNEAQKKDVFDSNQKTDMFNADAFNKASLANAQMQNGDRRYTAELMANAAAQKMAADTSWYSAPYGMLSEIASVRNARDLQNRRFNPVIAMANAGIVGAPNEEVGVLVGNRNRKSKGGKLKKKGLTF